MRLRVSSLLSAAALASTSAALYVSGNVSAPCNSTIYCHGELLKAVELAQPFSDSKTFVDMPAIKPLEEVYAAFEQLEKPLSNNSALHTFLRENFDSAGGELTALATSSLTTNATFLTKVHDTVLREFAEKVIDIWPDLTRQYVGRSNCSSCPNSFIPVERPFVIAGGRFREPYYWDTLWIIEGLLRSGGSFVELARNAIENFLDFVDQFGFVPNGARIYYLNRSQPPVLALMTKVYIEHTNDTSILERALPLLEKEYNFWMTNRSVAIHLGNSTYTLNQYNVDNTQPRPESYREDYITATNASYYAEDGIIYPGTALNDSKLATLYANLASGAESGWDYSSRWLRTPGDAIRDVYFPLRSLNVIDLVPVDLNSILYGVEDAMALFHSQTGNSSGSDIWTKRAAARSDAMQSVFWNESSFSYFDYNLTSSRQNVFVPLDGNDAEEEITASDWAPPGMKVLRSVSSYYPFWTGSAPAYLRNNTLAVQRAFAPIIKQLETTPGGIPATNVASGQQWDFPNVWPPHMHILMSSLRAVPATFGPSDPSYIAVQDLSLRLAQRYVDSAFCTWYATGGSTSQTPKLSGLPASATGVMFEKYSAKSTNSAGGGGEYEVVEGFGWSNGVLLWAVDEFAGELTRPDCGNVTAAMVVGKRQRKRAVEVDRFDAGWIKNFGG
ncbi:hypothetical protein TD95_003669 [Thielaviopsis punctulata]|uniref:Trehalase n=1 Tax=Thielaviopsis punctulata TaxID=72032 RepID=A0A0F4ZJK4_9PEZI|nr:hypothetical protein TD95_003669 [Thielaviopsis punctulata]